MNIQRTVTWAFALATILFGSLHASAQGPRTSEPFVTASDRAHAIAQREAPRAAFTRHVRDLARAAATLDRDDPPYVWAQVDAHYYNARRSLLAPDIRPSDPLLDAWDDVVVARRHLERRPPPPPIAVVPRLEFQARVGHREIRAVGRNHQELFADCERQMLAAGPAIGSELWVEGDRVATRRRGMTVNIVCGTAVLSSTYIGTRPPTELLHGRIGRIPFVLRAPIEEARQIVYRYAPMVVGELTVRRITIEGRGYVNYAAFTPAGAVYLLDTELMRRQPQQWIGMR